MHAWEYECVWMLATRHLSIGKRCLCEWVNEACCMKLFEYRRALFNIRNTESIDCAEQQSFSLLAFITYFYGFLIYFYVWLVADISLQWLGKLFFLFLCDNIHEVYKKTDCCAVCAYENNSQRRMVTECNFSSMSKGQTCLIGCKGWLDCWADLSCGCHDYVLTLPLMYAHSSQVWENSRKRWPMQLIHAHPIRVYLIPN